MASVLKEAATRTARVASSRTRIAASVKAALKRDSILVRWPSEGGASSNWGDKLNPVLVEMLSQKRVVNCKDVVNVCNRPVYSVIGSSLASVQCGRVTVWGTGFISYDSWPKVKFRRVNAVRGPLSRAKLLSAGIRCPQVFGDPALLCSRLFPLSKTPKFELGLIPQWRDKGLSLVRRLAEDPRIHVIDIQGDITTVLEEITACRYIASSSLHGLIAADAYKVPTLWIRLSENPQGDFFKFHDYFASVGKEVTDPFYPSHATDARTMIDRVTDKAVEVDLELLLKACPFRTASADVLDG